jgi:hypothetical protein
MSAEQQIFDAAPPHAAGDGALLLTADELAELTGTRQAARQRRWLEANCWPFVNAVGRRSHPRVARAVFLERMRNPEGELSRREPRLDALDRLAKWGRR